MKSSKPEDLRHLSDAELEGQIVDNTKALADMRFALAVGTLEDTAAMAVVKRDIARMKTILAERSRAASAA